MFYGKTKKRKTEPAPPGTGLYNEYSITIDEDGHKSVKKTGETDLYAKIQESLSSVLIENIIKRAELGDPGALDKYKTQFVDTIGLPDTLAQAQQSIINITKIFEKLPIEIKKEYNFAPEQFVADFGSNKFNSIFFPENTPENIPTKKGEKNEETVNKTDT